MPQLEVEVDADKGRVPGEAEELVRQIPLCQWRVSVVDELDHARQSTHHVHAELDPLGCGGNRCQFNYRVHVVLWRKGTCLGGFEQKAPKFSNLNPSITKKKTSSEF